MGCSYAKSDSFNMNFNFLYHMPKIFRNVCNRCLQGCERYRIMGKQSLIRLRIRRNRICHFRVVYKHGY
jgi:hypothetical protein